MKVLLTGGSGFVGGQLAKALVSRGDEVVALVRRSSKVDALKALGVRAVAHTGASRLQLILGGPAAPLGDALAQRG